MADYSLLIEREQKISELEWLTICEKDNSLTVQDTFVTKNPKTGELIEIDTPHSCVWITPVLKKKFYFTFSNGTVSFSYDKATVKKAKKIAALLNAKIIGDEGEEY